MKDHIPVIQKDPSPLAFPFDAQRTDVFFLQFLFDVGGDRLNLAIRVSAADDEIVGKRRKIFDFQDNKVDDLVVQSRSGAV